MEGLPGTDGRSGIADGVDRVATCIPGRDRAEPGMSMKGGGG